MNGTLRFWHAGHPVHLALGLSLWALIFVVAYGGVSWHCEAVAPAHRSGAVPAMLLLGCVAATLALGVTAWRCRRTARTLPRDGTPDVRQQRFIATVAAALYLWAAAATALVALPLALIAPCV